jgi:phosphoglycerate dehydrogenase-like enzyme
MSLGGIIMNILVAHTLHQKEQDYLLKTFPKHHFNFLSTKEILQADVNQADIIIGNLPISINLYRDTLQFVQLQSAGSDYYIAEGILHPNTKLANSSGSLGHAIAEHTIGMILALNKNIPYYVKNMQTKTWQHPHMGKELYHKTALIIGLGDLGYQVAKRLKAFDMHIIGMKRRVSPIPKSIDELYTIDALDTVLPKAEYVILCLPQTKDTIHIINKERLLAMKNDALLVNIGRGSAIDTNALIEVLQKGHLYGVALDVMEEEPLPKENSLWQFDNVLLTPHSAGGFQWDSYYDHFFSLLLRNLHHFFNNESLENSVDRGTGYRKDTTIR